MDLVTAHATAAIKDKERYGELHRLACKRHLKDLKKSKRKDFPYRFDEKAAMRAIAFAETLTIAEGKKPKQIKLYPHQQFSIGSLFGWVHKETGFKRFRRRYTSMARQNGKTFENGITGTYIMLGSGYRHGKCFTAATKKRQARLAWEEVFKFIKIDPDLDELFKLQEYKNLITCLPTSCTLEALSKEAGLDDGFRSIFNSIDEIHQHRDNSIYKALYNGTRSLDETLNSMITTRGKNLNSFCKEMDDYAIGILKEAYVADDFFVDIYCLDEGDDFFDEKVWIKANPVLCTTATGIATQKRDAETARQMGGSELVDYVTKCCNLWFRDINTQFVDGNKFPIFGIDKTIADFKGHECYLGLDLSSGGDLTTITFEFVLADDTIYFDSHSFMPKGRFEEHIKTDIAPYDVWEREKLITLTGGNSDFVTDYDYIFSHIDKLVSTYNLKIKAIGADPANLAGIISKLETYGAPVISVTQSFKNLNDATKEVQDLFCSKKIFYNKKNELLVWSFINAVIVKNSYGLIKIDKDERGKQRRIDPVDSMIDAHFAKISINAAPQFDVNKSVEAYFDNYDL